MSYLELLPGDLLVKEYIPLGQLTDQLFGSLRQLLAMFKVRG